MAITLNGLDNQTKVITMNALGEYDNLRPQVKPVEATHAQMVAMRDQGKLIPGQLYRITDYVTTTMQGNTQSAGHPFDIIVMALDATTLSEEAWAIQHDGDEYFVNSNLAAWKLRYTLDNIEWSQVKGKFVVPDYTELKFEPKGTIEIDGTTYYLWYNEDDTTGYDDYGMTAGYIATDTQNPQAGDTVYFVDLDQGTTYDDDYHVSIYGNYEEDGKGTITWLKDEFHNECPYDFKNVQFKRWKITDTESGREGLDGLYMGILNDTAENLSIEDGDDFIWVFTFSSDAAGGVQTDYSLGGNNVKRNRFSPNEDGSLPDNVFFGGDNWGNSFGRNCYGNSWGNNCHDNSWGNNCHSNSLGNDCQNNSWGNDCRNNSWGNGSNDNSWGNNCWNNSWGNGSNNNSWGNDCQYNSLGNDYYNNSWGNDCQYNSLGNDYYNNSWGNNCHGNSLGNNCHDNSWGNDCRNNSWGNSISSSTVFDGVQYTQITTDNVKNVQVLNGVASTSISNKLTLSFADNKTYTQVAAKTSAGVLKIYVPGDLA